MPFTIDLAACKKQMFLDTSKPQEKIPDGPLPEGWLGTLSRGLPVLEIPIYEFPKILYLNPVRPFRVIEHTNQNFEVVGTETVPTEHLTRAVSCDAHKNGGPKDCADCNDAMAAAIADGWRKDPYMPEAPPKKDADLYGRK